MIVPVTSTVIQPLEAAIRCGGVTLKHPDTLLPQMSNVLLTLASRYIVFVLHTLPLYWVGSSDPCNSSSTNARSTGSDTGVSILPPGAARIQLPDSSSAKLMLWRF
jgi:hypothetical protein